MEPSLYKAYQQAVYVVVYKGLEKQIKVAVHSIWLDELLTEFDVKNAVFITAFNPKSIILSDEENRINNLSLKNQIKQSGYQYLNGYSTNQTRSWPKEEFFLVFDVNLEKAQELTKLFNQNAYLSLSFKQPVQLVSVL